MRDIRAISHRRSAGPGAGVRTTGPNGLDPNAQTRVLRDESIVGDRPLRTIVRYRDLWLEIDIFGVLDSKGLIPDQLIHSLALICPRCGPNAPQGSPQGQVIMRGYDVKPHLVGERACPACIERKFPLKKNSLGECYTCSDRGVIPILTIEENLRCSFLCGWKVKVEDGVASDVGWRNLFSRISWNY